MVELNTLLLACMIVAPVSAIATVAFFLLLGVYFGIKEIKKVKEETNDENVYSIPLSSLGSLGGRTITQADVDRAKTAMAQYYAGQGAGHHDSECTDKKEEKPALGGQYL